MEKLGHIALFGAEAVLMIVIFWACNSALRPDAIRVTNDTAREVTLLNCQYSLGSTNPVNLSPGNSSDVHAVRACQVNAPEYVGCLSFNELSFGQDGAVRVSRMNSRVAASDCGDRPAKQAQPSAPGQGRN